ncbi:MAG TPA: hypothetical protein VHM01_10520 [Alphaproteobacteria bacterium]|nr:hypothetical protein [Alphaproteobacteria bacterium]
MTHGTVPAPTTSGRTSLKRFGHRNVAYIAFVIILIPAGIALEATGPRGPDSGGGIMIAIIVWALASLAFLLVNAVLAAIALVKGRPARVPAIAAALPLGIILAMLALGEFMSAAGLL